MNARELIVALLGCPPVDHLLWMPLATMFDSERIGERGRGAPLTSDDLHLHSDTPLRRNEISATDRPLWECAHASSGGPFDLPSTV